MKKLMLTMAGLLLVSLMAVNAQVTQDTSSLNQPSTGYQDDMNMDNMEPLQSTDVPASLRSTLQGSEYSGWEEGKVYRNTTSNEYIVVVGDEDAKVYRFDSNGQRIEDGSQSGEAGQDQSGQTDTGSGSTGTTGSGSTGTTGSGSTGTTGSGSTGTTPTE